MLGGKEGTHPKNWEITPFFSREESRAGDAEVNKLLRAPAKKWMLWPRCRDRDSASPVLHLEKGMNTRSKECSTPCKTRETSLLLLSCLMTQKHITIFSFLSPDISWRVYSTDAAASAELTCAPKLEVQFEWRQGKKIFESFHNITSTRLDFIERSSTHGKFSLSSFLQHALSLKWQRQHTVYYPIPLCWWQIYPGISFQMLNGGFSPESEWFPVSHPLPPPSADVCFNCKNT